MISSTSPYTYSSIIDNQSAPADCGTTDVAAINPTTATATANTAANRTTVARTTVARKKSKNSQQSKISQSSQSSQSYTHLFVFWVRIDELFLKPYFGGSATGQTKSKLIELSNNVDVMSLLSPTKKINLNSSVKKKHEYR